MSDIQVCEACHSGIASMIELIEEKASAGKRERNKARNRTVIIEAARRCFIEQGYDAVTVRDIIGETDLASGTYYNYFPDKASVFKALVEDSTVEMNKRMHEVRSNARALEEFLYGAYLVAFTTVAEDPIFFAFILRNEPVVRDFYEDTVFGISIASLKSDIKDAIDRQVLPDTDVDYLAAAFYGVGFEMSRILVSRDQKDPERAARMATDILLGGVASIKPD